MAKASGNVLLRKDEANRTKPGVVKVSQILAVGKSELVESIGILSGQFQYAERDGLHMLFDRD